MNQLSFHRLRFILIAIVTGLFMACGGSGSAPESADPGNSDALRVRLAVPVPETINVGFCARIRISASDMIAITLDRDYPAATRIVEAVVPNIPAGPNRLVELGLFTEAPCGDFSAADWYGREAGVAVNAGEVSISEIALVQMNPTGAGTIIVRSGGDRRQVRLHGEVIQPDAVPIPAARCTITEGTQVLTLATSSTNTATLGALNTLVEVDPATTALQVTCTHPAYNPGLDTAELIVDPNDPNQMTFSTTVVMDNSTLATLPSFNVVGNLVTTDTAARLAEFMGLKYNPMGEDGAIRYIDDLNFHALPMTPLDATTDDEDGGTIGAEAFNFDAINQMPVMSQAEALSKIREGLDAAGLDPTGAGMNASVQMSHSLFEAVDQKGSVISRKEIDTQVQFNFVLNDLPVVGPGANVDASFDGKGLPVQINLALAKVEKGDSLPLLPAVQQRALAALVLQASEAVQANALASLQASLPQLVYYAPEPGLNARAYFPHYLFAGTIRSGDQTALMRNVLVPAVAAGPKVTLAATAAGGSISATASVEGGTTPYSFVWSSSTTELPEATAFNGSSINYDLKPKEAVSTETLSVLVTDANGLIAGATTDVAIDPIKTFAVARRARIMVGGIVDFGAEYIGTCQGLSGSAANAGGFVSTLQNSGAVKRFFWGNSSAWEQDFKDDTLGGDDQNWVDNSDIVFYTGHANGDGFTFCSNHDDGFLHFSEASWGNLGEDLEWLIIAACGPLQNNSSGRTWYQRWGPAFDGLHLLMAYATVSNDNTTEGRKMANYILGKPILFFTLPPLPVRSAWIQTAREVQPSSVVWSVMGVFGSGGATNYNDYFHGKGPVGPDIRGGNIVGYWKVSGNS